MNSPQQRYFVRLTLSQRIQHFILMVSTSLLIITGFMIQAEASLIASFGQYGDTVFWLRGWTHRIAGVIAIAACVYHIFYSFLSSDGRSWFVDMIPRPKDALDVYQNIMFMLGFMDNRPKMDRFFYLEKLEYWSVYFGMIIVISTGIVMWTEGYWPKFYLDVALAFHIGEATLAALAIIAGHLSFVLYHPHTYPAAKTVLNGLISEEQAKDEYEGWYEKEMARLVTEEVRSEEDA